MDGSPYADDPIDAGWREPPPAPATYRGAVRRQGWIVILCLLLSAAAGLAVIVLSDPRYTAHVSLYLEPEAGVEIRAEQILEMDLDTHVELIRSDETLAATIRTLGLDADPGFLPRQGTLRRIVLDLRSRLDRAPDPVPGATSDRILDLIRRLREDLRVGRVGNTRVVDVSYTSATPAFAVAVVDALAQSHLDGVSARDEASAVRRTGRLEARAEEMRQKAAEANARIGELLTASGQFAADPRELESHAATLRDRLSDLEAEIAVLSMRLDAMSAEPETSELAAVVAGTDESRRLLGEIATAQSRLQELQRRDEPNSEAVRKIEAALDAIRESLRQERSIVETSIDLQLAAARAEQTNIAEQIARLRGYIGGDLRSELEAVRQDLSFYEGMHQEYLTRLETLYRQPQARPDLRLVSDALMPTTPSSPNYKLVLAICLTFGMIVGLGLGLIREWNRQDRREAS